MQAAKCGESKQKERQKTGTGETSDPRPSWWWTGHSVVDDGIVLEAQMCVGSWRRETATARDWRDCVHGTRKADRKELDKATESS